MTEQELREKIADTLNATEISVELEKRDIYKFADALISAGIGDVSEWKHRAEVAEAELSRYTEMIARDDIYRRAEKAEKDNINYGRALYNLAVKYVSAANIWTITADDGKKYLAEKEICALYVINDEIKQAEKELQEGR